VCVLFVQVSGGQEKTRRGYGSAQKVSELHGFSINKILQATVLSIVKLVCDPTGTLARTVVVRRFGITELLAFYFVCV
jgi:hypothetical protein